MVEIINTSEFDVKKCFNFIFNITSTEDNNSAFKRISAKIGGRNSGETLT